MTLEFEVDVDYLTDGGIKDMPTWVKLNDEGGERTSTVYVNSSSYQHVVDEIAKLRELVRDMGELLDVLTECDLACKHYHDGCIGDCYYVNARRELGVEVEK